MNTDKKKKNLKKSLEKQLEDALNIAKDVNSSLNVIYTYCNYRNDSDTVHNVLHMLADLEQKSERICYIICKILNDKPREVDEFLSKIVPLDCADVIFED